MSAPPAEKKDHWSSELMSWPGDTPTGEQAYQGAADFVPKLATKVLQWLDPQPDDVILDLGCGDGVINIQVAADVLARGTGRIHGTDASASMISAAKKAAEARGLGEDKCSFEVVDATSIATHAPHLQTGAVFTKAFSNAAMHWILRPEATRAAFFAAVRDALVPGGTFAFEMGGLGNVVEMRTALLMAVARRCGGGGGMEAAMRADPWFFPDEAWIRNMMEEQVGGWKVERIEREYRPTPAADGAQGVEGWVRLMGARFFEAIAGETEREEAVREVVQVLDQVCAKPGGGWQYGYVRLRAVARKL